MTKEKVLLNSPEVKSSEQRRDSLEIEYKVELKDELVSRIAQEVGKGLPSLNQEGQASLINQWEQFLSSLRKYFGSYNGLKAAARKDRMLLLDIYKYQESIRNADYREKVLHDQFMSDTNILSRTMKSVGLDNRWRSDDVIYNVGGENDSSDIPARDKFREWMFRIYHQELFPS